MSYKIIFLDIDGTLTNAEKKVTPATKKALFEAQEKGYLAAIASGRPDRGVEGIAREIGLDKFGGFTLSYNWRQGAQLQDGRAAGAKESWQ